MSFRFRSGVNISYDQQGSIFFICHCYDKLDSRSKGIIDQLCVECGGEHSQALFEYMTTNRSVRDILCRNFIEASTLYRIARKFYTSFAEKVKISLGFDGCD